MTKRQLSVVAAVMMVASACSPASPAGGGGSGAGGSRNSGGSGGSVATATGGSGGQSAGVSTGGSMGSGGTATGGAGATATGGSGGSAGAGGSRNDAGADPRDAPAASNDSATSSDAGADRPAAAGPTCPTTAKFCDDFEGQTAGMQPTGNFRVNVANNGTLTVDSTKAFSGKQSILIKGPAGSFTSRLAFGAPLLPLPSNDLHGRAMVFMTAVPSGGVHWDNAIASGPLPGGGGNSSYVMGGMYSNFMAVYHPGDCSVDSSTKFPTGRWACLQWQFKGAADGTHVLRMMMDGKLVDKGEVTTMGPANCVGGGAASREWKAPNFTSLTFGWINYQRSAIPIEMWVDDLAFGEQAIPCPTAP